MVDVDVATSKHMDLLQQGAVFQVLIWAALNGKIKAVVGGPPRHGFPAMDECSSLSPQQLEGVEANGANDVSLACCRGRSWSGVEERELEADAREASCWLST